MNICIGKEFVIPYKNSMRCLNLENIDFMTERFLQIILTLIFSPIILFNQIYPRVQVLLISTKTRGSLSFYVYPIEACSNFFMVKKMVHLK